MQNSRNLNDLHPLVEALARSFLDECKKQGIDILVTSTYRDYESQQALYDQGRITSGNIVTNAKPGYSMHNFRNAFDVVPLRNGKPVWGLSNPEDKALWFKVGAIGKSVGLEWAGDWKSFKEYAHFQYTQGLTTEDFRKGKSLA
jgi:peptidoglycan L-alanyl-D-glutamate endopeptidase CwlK